MYRLKIATISLQHWPRSLFRFPIFRSYSATCRPPAKPGHTSRRDGCPAARWPPCHLRHFFPAWRPFRYLTDTVLVCLFMLTDGRGDSVDIEVVSSANGFPELVQFVNDGIVTLHTELPVGSSSGVQMTGGHKPAERQIVSIVPRIVAFAMCLQFHVRRYTT
jgi:hypothetical protein